MYKRSLWTLFVTVFISLPIFGYCQESPDKYFVGLASIHLEKRYYIIGLNELWPSMRFDKTRDDNWLWLLDDGSTLNVESSIDVPVQTQLVYCPKANVVDGVMTIELNLVARRYEDLSSDIVADQMIKVDLTTLQFDSDGRAVTAPIPLDQDGGSVQLLIEKRNFPNLTDAELIYESLQQQRNKEAVAAANAAKRAAANSAHPGLNAPFSPYNSSGRR